MDSEKLDVFTQTHRHNGILLSHKKNEILPFVKTSIDPENIILSEMSDTEGWMLCGISYMLNLKNKINECI